MGLDRVIRFPNSQPPKWDAVCKQLARVGETGQLRMIDGLPAFPDEIPAEDWKELRVGTQAGMVTIRRTPPNALTCIIWGNADQSLNLAWAKIIWACAGAGGGVIESPAGSISADQFAQSEGLSPT